MVGWFSELELVGHIDRVVIIDALDLRELLVFVLRTTIRISLDSCLSFAYVFGQCILISKQYCVFLAPSI